MVIDPLASYRALCLRVDRFCDGIREKLADQLACRKGCDSCCRHISLFPVEAVALRMALDDLPREMVETLRARVGGGESDACPLLMDGGCVVYASRPVICRTHGFPLIVRDGDRTMVDVCPLNCTGIDSLSGDSVLDLDRLTLLLVAVNADFVKHHSAPLPERIRVRDIVLGRFP
ncbi:MAG: hypothetical protein Fur0034_21640 [Desulfuromonadia bacterium]